MPIVPTLDVRGDVRCLTCCKTPNHVAYVAENRRGGFGVLKSLLDDIELQLQDGSTTTFGEWARGQDYFEYW